MEKESRILILIVEDEDYIVRVLQDNLAPRGCLIDVVRDGQKAVEYLKEHAAPDLILLDLIMPNRDGFYVLQQVKENEKWKDIPVFVLSNLGETEDVHRAMELGANDYFVKAHNTILEVVNRAMSILESKKPAIPKNE
ncbi:MAG: response regulator [bacterium]|nr:response regulator [bacterium]